MIRNKSIPIRVFGVIIVALLAQPVLSVGNNLANGGKSLWQQCLDAMSRVGESDSAEAQDSAEPAYPGVFDPDLEKGHLERVLPDGAVIAHIQWLELKSKYKRQHRRAEIVSTRVDTRSLPEAFLTNLFVEFHRITQFDEIKITVSSEEFEAAGSLDKLKLVVAARKAGFSYTLESKKVPIEEDRRQTGDYIFEAVLSTHPL